MGNKGFSRASLVPLLGLAVAWSVPASATILPDDPLHAFCYGGSSCTDNGTVTPTTSNPPNFGFSVSPGPQTGTYFVDVLLPNIVANPSALSFSITGTQGGPSNSSSISATASLFSTTAWTSGALDTYLGISASPTNPIGAWLPTTKTFSPTATGYFVYQANLGSNKLQPNSTELSGPLLKIGGSTLLIGSDIAAFLDTGDGIIATASSGVLAIEGPPTPPTNVTEPTTLAIFGVGLIGLGLVRRRRAR